jgi:predicted enzyme related to lactoylglutathione lyase
MSELLTWVEIPAADFERAVNFYSTILASKLRAGEFMGVPHGFFDDAKGGSGGAVIATTDPTLYAGGPLVYMHVDNLDEVVGRVTAAGGAVLLPKTSIGPQGTIAVIRDTEGNRVGLHSMAA